MDFECLVLRGEEEKGLNTNRRQVCSGHIGTVTYLNNERQKHMNTVACLITHKLCIFWKQHRRPRQRRLLSMVMRNLPPKRLCIERRTERTSYEADHLSCKIHESTTKISLTIFYYNHTIYSTILRSSFNQVVVVPEGAKCFIYDYLDWHIGEEGGSLCIVCTKHLGYDISSLRNFSTGPTLSVTCLADQWSHFFSGKHFRGAMLHGLLNRNYACVSEKDGR